MKEDEFLKGLVSLKLLRADNPDKALFWTNFYKNLKIDASTQDEKKTYFEIKSTMIALYFLTSCKA
jgi:hypothetical protein